MNYYQSGGYKAYSQSVFSFNGMEIEVAFVHSLKADLMDFVYMVLYLRYSKDGPNNNSRNVMFVFMFFIILNIIYKIMFFISISSFLL